MFFFCLQQHCNSAAISMQKQIKTPNLDFNKTFVPITLIPNR